MTEAHLDQKYHSPHHPYIATDPIDGLREMRSRLVADLEVLNAAIGRLEARTEDASFAFGEVTVSSEDLRAAVDAQGLTHRVRLRRIADLVGGRVNVTQAADAMVRLGVSRASKANLMTHLHDLATKSDDWEKVSPGTFRHVGPGPPVD